MKEKDGTVSQTRMEEVKGPCYFYYTRILGLFMFLSLDNDEFRQEVPLKSGPWITGFC
jgi:hypothetical protein